MAELCKPLVLAVTGPTATGKSALGVQLAHALNGEIISADSMQLYCGLDIGTAKVTAEEMQGVPHYGVNMMLPEMSFSVADFVALAQQWIQEITARGKLPILVGGTGLYLESLLSGVHFAPDKADPALRSALETEWQARGAAEMYQMLMQLDPQAASATHPNNKVRVLRALEHYRATGQTLSAQKAISLPEERPYKDYIFGLDFPDRSQLYARINARIDHMMEAGLLTEAEMVYQNRERYRTAAQAIGYKELFPYLAGEQPVDSCVEKLKQASRNYAKRQLTWFRRMPDIHWLDAGASDVAAQALLQAQRFLEEHTQT